MTKFKVTVATPIPGTSLVRHSVYTVRGQDRESVRAVAAYALRDGAYVEAVTYA